MKLASPIVLLCLTFIEPSISPRAKYNEPSVSRLRADVSWLSSSKLEGRLSLSHGADLGAHYIADEFKRVGLDPISNAGYLQTFPLVGYRVNSGLSRLVVKREGMERRFRYGQDFRGGYWQDISINAPVMFVGYGITAPEYSYDDYKGIDVHRKIALAFDHEPQDGGFHSKFGGSGNTRYGSLILKAENAQRHGAIALLVVSEPLRRHRGPFDAPDPLDERSLRGTAPRQALNEVSIPWIQISDAVAIELLKSNGRSPAELQTKIDRDASPASFLIPNTFAEFSIVPEHIQHGTSANVIGLIEGSDPKLRSENVVISAHYDHLGIQNGHLYPGANDNASGTAAIMELARLFTADSVRPRRSILLIVFGSEEEGLLGSRYYVEHPVRNLTLTAAVINLDMIARDEAHIPQSRGAVDIPSDTSNEINLVGSFYSPDLRDVVSQANENVGLELSTKFDNDHDMNALFRCDHFPFLLHDVPAVWLFGGWHPDYHEPSDVVEKLNFDKYSKVVRLAYVAARSIADSRTRPRFVPSVK